MELTKPEIRHESVSDFLGSSLFWDVSSDILFLWGLESMALGCLLSFVRATFFLSVEVLPESVRLVLILP